MVISGPVTVFLIQRIRQKLILLFRFIKPVTPLFRQNRLIVTVVVFIHVVTFLFGLSVFLGNIVVSGLRKVGIEDCRPVFSLVFNKRRNTGNIRKKVFVVLVKIRIGRHMSPSESVVLVVPNGRVGRVR